MDKKVEFLLEENRKKYDPRLTLNIMQLTQMPDLSSFVWVTDLSLRHNKISKIIKNYLPPNLEIFDISNNELDEIKGEDLLESITRLTLTTNHIIEFDGNQFPNIKKLSLDCNAVKNFIFPPNIVKIDLSYNEISVLANPPESLKVLDITENKLHVLPKFSNNLQKLSVSRNLIKILPYLPDSVLELYATDNFIVHIAKLPESLEILSLSNNRINKVDDFPPKLKHIDLSDNAIESLPPLPSSVNDLIISQNRIKDLGDIPDSVMRLDCSNNFITEIPENILARSKSVLTLICHGNFLDNDSDDHTLIDNGSEDSDDYDDYWGKAFKTKNNNSDYKFHESSIHRQYDNYLDRNESLHNESLHNESLHNESLHNGSLHNGSLHNRSINKSDNNINLHKTTYGVRPNIAYNYQSNYIFPNYLNSGNNMNSFKSINTGIKARNSNNPHYISGNYKKTIII